MSEKFLKIYEFFANFNAFDAFCILMLAFVLYITFKMLLVNNAFYLIVIYILLIIISGFFVIIFNVDGIIYLIIPCAFEAFVVIVFAAEIKREIWKRDNISFFENKALPTEMDQEIIQRNITEIIKAMQNMSKGDVGALIILVHNVIPDHITQSGVTLNSEISAPLIESIFAKNTPLHDGAMLIKGGRIMAAGCFLPLSQKANILKELGTRHRAGIGITEATETTALIVSEESGIISAATQGKLIRYLDSEALKEILTNYFTTLMNDKK